MGQRLSLVAGAGFVPFAKSQPDTPGKLTAYTYSFEHLELASYELLMRVAERAGDAETAEVARRIRDQEATMAQRLESHFDAAIAASRNPNTGKLAAYVSAVRAPRDRRARALEARRRTCGRRADARGRRPGDRPGALRGRARSQASSITQSASLAAQEVTATG